MAMVLTDAGAVSMLTSYLKKQNPVGGNDLTLRLFTNDMVPGDTSSSPSFYTEASGGGYAAKTLLATGWSASINESGVATAEYAPQSYMFTGALDGAASIRGAYIVDADGVVVAAGLSATPFTPQSNGQSCVVLPTVKLSTGITG